MVQSDSPGPWQWLDTRRSAGARAGTQRVRAGCEGCRMSDLVAGQVAERVRALPEVEGTSSYARLNRYRLFDEVNAPYMRWQLEQFEPFLGPRLLEVGCGVGSILAQLSPREFVMGVDVEDEMVAVA